MNAVVLLVLTLSGDGYWLSGQTAVVGVEWNVPPPAGRTEFAWRLMCGNAQLAVGRSVVPGGRRGEIRLDVPMVRVPTEAELVYEVRQPAEHRELTKGRLAAHLYPTGLLVDVGKRLQKKRLVVWDRADGLPAVLKAAGVPHRAIADSSQLSFAQPDMLLVGSQQLPRGTMSQSPLVNLAAAGSSVLILAQSQPATLAGYALLPRPSPARLDWNRDHPLTRHLRLSDPSGKPAALVALQLPADEPALELAWWPREAPGKKPVPIDALVAVKAVGRGRIAFCQVPLGPWQSDPRSQLFLADALDYLATRAEPTPPPSRRPKPEPTLSAPASQITLPSGDSP